LSGRWQLRGAAYPQQSGLRQYRYEKASEIAFEALSFWLVFLYLIGEVCQKHVCASEVTDLSSSQMKADRSALIIAHGMKF
jgi:hypothetical protein